jgi:hypothetical protein
LRARADPFEQALHNEAHHREANKSRENDLHSPLDPNIA